MVDEPMSDERLAEIRARAEAIRDWLLTPESDNMPHFPTSRRILGVDSLALLAEVERLRAREAAAMAIVRAVAQNDMVMPLRDSVQCVFWDCEYDYISDHSSNCPVTKARALLADEGH